MMPLELGGVVGRDLLDYGVKGLSVVDANVVPLVPSTNLCATVYAVAEKVRNSSYCVPAGLDSCGDIGCRHDQQAKSDVRGCCN